MAGESAEEVARRTREKIARLDRHAERFEKGAAGEAMTAAALAMLPADWVVLHDVRWPGRRVANIDHIAIGPGGVFVIDSKNWTGRVEVRDGALRQNGYKREHAVAGAADAALAVAGVVPGLDPRLVHPVICLVGDQPMIASSRGVGVCSSASLVEFLSRQVPVLGPTGVRNTTAWLRSVLPSAADRPLPGPTAGSRPARPARPLRAVRPGPLRRMPRLARWLIGSILVGLVGLVGLVVAVVLVAAITAGAGGDGRALGGRSIGAPAPAAHLGVTQHLARATNRPPLSLEVDRFRTVRGSQEVSNLWPGNRWAAAHVTIHNAGRQAWRSKPGTVWIARDADGAEYRERGIVTTGAGPTLPALVHLPPGKTTSGWIVFQVPLDKAVVQVTVTVGPGQPATASWVVDRQ